MNSDRYLADLNGAHGHIRTFTGKYIDPLNPELDVIDLTDIAHALSNQCRFAGHTPKFYSIAQHSMRVADHFVTPRLRLAGLLHDAEEAYLMDMPKPIKRRMPAYSEAGVELRKMIFAKFGLHDHDALMADIHHADQKELRLEMDTFFGPAPGSPLLVPFKPGACEVFYKAAVELELQCLAQRKAA